MGQEVRCWDPPSQTSGKVRLPALAAAQPLGQSPQGGLLEMVGHWSNFECVIEAAVDWLDVTFRLVRTVGGVETVLDVRQMGDIRHSLGGRVGGVLFSVRGRPGDRFRVDAWRTLVTHTEATIYAFAWGEDGGFGDRAIEQPVALYARTDQSRAGTTGLAGLAVGTTVILAANPLPRGRVCMTELVWTRSDLGVGNLTLLLEETDGTDRAAWISNAEAGVGAQSVEVRETWSIPPMRSAPGNGFQLTLSAGATPAQNIVNWNAYNE